jgi:ribosomal protein S18 acetylase RimI-like enzyme
MRVSDTPELLLVDSGLASDTFNIVCRTRLEPSTVDRRIEETVASFGAERTPFAWWVGPACAPSNLGERLDRAGLQSSEVEIGMGFDISRLATFPAPRGLVVRQATTADDVATYARLLSRLSEPADESFNEYYRRAASTILGPGSPMRLYVGYLDGEPVAGSELYLEHGVAGVYGVATLPRARRLGVGTAMTGIPLQEAQAAGAEVAVLQAAPDGAGLYARLGFEPCGEFVVHQSATVVGRSVAASPSPQSTARGS